MAKFWKFQEIRSQDLVSESEFVKNSALPTFNSLRSMQLHRNCILAGVFSAAQKDHLTSLEILKQIRPS